MERLRADLRRLFDAGNIVLEANTWTLNITEAVRKDYGQYHGMNLGVVISKIEDASKLAAALRKRMDLAAQQK